MKLFVALIIVLAVAGGAATLGWFHKHPCIRYETQMCQSMYCAAYNTDMTCMVWVDDDPYPCQVCVERK